MKPCEYHPYGQIEPCRRPASRQVFIVLFNNYSYYMPVCDRCLPIAEAHWRKMLVEYEL